MLTMEFLKLQLAAARRLLKSHYYHTYCNMHEGETYMYSRCPGCRRSKKDRDLVFKKGAGR